MLLKTHTECMEQQPEDLKIKGSHIGKEDRLLDLAVLMMSYHLSLPASPGLDSAQPETHTCTRCRQTAPGGTPSLAWGPEKKSPNGDTEWRNLRLLSFFPSFSCAPRPQSVMAGPQDISGTQL